MADQSHERFMALALAEAQRAYDEDEVPVGAVVVHEGRIIGRGHNRREALNDPTAHAEILALTAASNHLSNWRLTGCTLYVTKEPCPMCAGALVGSRVDAVVFGIYDEIAGCCGSLYQLCRDPRFNHQLEVTGGVLEEPCQEIIAAFFRQKRSSDS